MKNEQIIRAVAGTLVLTGITLSHLVNHNWIWLSAFVGANLLQSAFSKWCPLEKILEMKRRPVNTPTGEPEQLSKFTISKRLPDSA